MNNQSLSIVCNGRNFDNFIQVFDQIFNHIELEYQRDCALYLKGYTDRILNVSSAKAQSPTRATRPVIEILPRSRTLDVEIKDDRTTLVNHTTMRQEQPAPENADLESNSTISLPKKRTKSDRFVVSPGISDNDHTASEPNIAPEQPFGLPEKTTFGFKTRAEFRKNFAKVSPKMYPRYIKRIGDELLYPTICTNSQCTLCISWYIGSAVTPCHPTYCDGKCAFNYAPHTTKYGLKMLKRYHSRIKQFPIHCNQSEPDGPQYENSLVQSGTMQLLFSTLSPRIQTLVKIAMDINTLNRTSTYIENVSDDGNDELGNDGSHLPLLCGDSIRKSVTTRAKKR
jgi:hypothetical protein